MDVTKRYLKSALYVEQRHIFRKNLSRNKSIENITLSKIDKNYQKDLIAEVQRRHSLTVNKVREVQNLV